MKCALRWLLLVAGLIVVVRADETPAAPVYELRIYTTNPGKMPDLLTRFRDHTCALFAKHGMENVGYWLPLDPAESNKLYYVLKHRNREAAKASWQAFGADPEWKAVVAASEANGKIVTAVESTYLTLTDYSPALPKLTGGHVFELR
ncbi:MAG TPA: NIPSNAP family protein, partial [Candidatus Didemnitutus sp.]|nr:NIPSNAP family protein [Candidatus Didemnitutus sp.]